MKKLMLLALLVLVYSCKTEVPDPTPPLIFSNTFIYDSLQLDERFESMAHLSSNTITVLEASGVVQTSLDPDLVWMINDSGNLPELFLVSVSSGSTLIKLRMKDFENVDWEDMAHFTDNQGKRFLCIADIGDNFGVRDSVKIYMFKEPSWTELDTSLAFQDYQPTDLRQITFSYDDSPKDAEALMVHPVSGEFYIVDKRSSSNGLYKINEVTGLAEFQGDLSMYLCTAADAKLVDDRLEVIIRNYDRLLIWQGSKNESISSIMSKEPKLLPYTYPEKQGESLWFTTDNSIGTASEKRSGVLAKIAIYKKL